MNNYQVFAYSSKRKSRNNIAVIAAENSAAAIARCAILNGYKNAQEYIDDHNSDVTIGAEIADAAHPAVRRAGPAPGR
jgi:hypothetical protein